MTDEHMMRVLNALAAAISLLECSPKTGAPSDKMFDMMVADYRRALQNGRASMRVSYDRG